MFRYFNSIRLNHDSYALDINSIGIRLPNYIKKRPMLPAAEYYLVITTSSGRMINYTSLAKGLARHLWARLINYRFISRYYEL